MISKNKIKYIRSLELKKNRNKEGKFVAEGFKVVDDLLALQPADLIVATQEWLHGKHLADQTEVIEVTEEELKKVSFLQHPQQVLAVSDRIPAAISRIPTTLRKMRRRRTSAFLKSTPRN